MKTNNELAKKAFETIKNKGYDIYPETMHRGYSPTDDEEAKVIDYVEENLKKVSLEDIEVVANSSENLEYVEDEREAVRVILSDLVRELLNEQFIELEEMDNWEKIREYTVFPISIR